MIFLFVWLRSFIFDFDYAMNSSVSSFWSPALIWLMTLITNVGSGIMFYLIMLVVVGYFIYVRRWKKIFILVSSLIIGGLLVTLFKDGLARLRPSDALLDVGGFSFPSGHATMRLILFGGLLYCFKDEISDAVWRLVFMITMVMLIFLIGFSRIFLAVHWMSDVLAGWFLGLGVLLLMIFLADRIFKKS
jgi:undecaprenyl-diphosphatase